MASTCCAPALTPTPSMRPGSSRATRSWPTSNATSASSKPTTSTYDPSTTASTSACAPTCRSACWPATSWHLRKAWAPLTYTDEHPPARDNPVAPAQRSAAANAKVATKRDTDGNPLRSFRGLIDHLGTLTRDRIRYHDTDIEIDKLTEPAPDQRRAFDLINSTIPLTIAA